MNIEIKRCTDAVRPGQAGVSPFVLAALRALRLDPDSGDARPHPTGNGRKTDTTTPRPT
jgi:hypothetical protein